jgi:energy-coupling factor transporter ATP-binding protein EcfA2
MTVPLIAVEGVGRCFLTSSGAVDALADVSLWVGEGEFCTIIGPSGCGKSTLLGMLGGLVALDAGRDVDRQLLTVARSFGARPRQLYLKVIVPAIVSSVIAAMRLAVVFCLLGVLVVEMFAGLRGMGSLMGAYANGFRAPELFAATALVSAASIAIVFGLDAVNERLSRWR